MTLVGAVMTILAIVSEVTGEFGSPSSDIHVASKTLHVIPITLRPNIIAYNL